MPQLYNIQYHTIQYHIHSYASCNSICCPVFFISCGNNIRFSPDRPFLFSSFVHIFNICTYIYMHARDRCGLLKYIFLFGKHHCPSGDFMAFSSRHTPTKTNKHSIWGRRYPRYLSSQYKIPHSYTYIYSSQSKIFGDNNADDKNTISIASISKKPSRRASY